MLRLALLALLALPLPTAHAGGELQLPPPRTGLLYISGYTSDNIGEYLPDGTLLRTVSHPSMDAPRGLGIDSLGRLVAVCQGSDRLLFFDHDLNVQQEIQHPDLTSGTGIGRSADGRWYVGNFSPGRVLVFAEDGTYLETISRSNMSGVNCVSFDPDGSFAVSDASNHKVHRFAADHTYLGEVNHSSLSSPMSIARDSSGNHYVSNGSGGTITRFDAAWNVLGTFGSGILSAPQQVMVDEHDVLTITNYAASVVHRFDTGGNLLSSFPLVGVTVARNAVWQYSPYLLARQGSVDRANGYPERVLFVNGSTGDALGRLTVDSAAPFELELSAPPSGPAPTPIVLWATIGEPGASDVHELPFGDGLLAFHPSHAGGSGQTVLNSLGRLDAFGAGRFMPGTGPGTLLAMPGGIGRTLTITLQGIVRDDGSAGSSPYSATNCLVLDVR